MSGIQSIFMIAGEPSGDLHGAGLVREIKAADPSIRIFGIGGDHMQAEGMTLHRHVKEMAFLGFAEVVRHLPFIRKVFSRMLQLIRSEKPDLIVLIDYPGFNLRFAKAVRKFNIPVVYYISPQVWAWKEGRKKKMARFVDRMLVIFPFEKAIYEAEGMDVHFVGHPLKDEFIVRQSRKAFCGQLNISPRQPLIGLLPGSRRQEVEKILPVMIEAFQLLKKRFPNLIGLVGQSPALENRCYNMVRHVDGIRLISRMTPEVMAYSRAVMVASGTATLETAICGTPMVVLYKLSPFSYLIGRLLVKLSHISLVNIVAGGEVVPELIQQDANPKAVAEQIGRWLSNEHERQSVIRDLKTVAEKLGKPGASKRAADLILQTPERIK